MKKSFGVGAAALGLISLGLVAVPTPAQAAGSVAVVDIAVSGDQATISQSTIRPGVVEFHVGSTFTIPGDQGGPDTLSIVRTDRLNDVLALLPAVFGGDPGNPAALAAAAQSITAIHAMTTWFGGADKGGVWQVKLPPGNYYALGVQSTAMGMAKPAAFTVAGAERPGVVHATQATVRAVGPVGNNKWMFTQVGSQPIQWLRFTNAAHELHFMDMTGIKPGTTSAQVKAGIASGAPPKWAIGPDISFDVISPGVSVAIKTAVPAGTFLVVCFMPSEADGMPHAMMGMYKIVDVA